MKCPLFISNILSAVVSAVLVVQCLCEESKPDPAQTQNPEIESKWQMTSYGGWYLEGRDHFDKGVSFQNDPQDMILTSSVTKVILICSAHYPVYWTYDLPDGEGRTTPSAYLHRMSDDFKDPKTYKFYSYITLTANSGLNTGTFTCRSAMDQEKQTSRFIYYQGTTRKMVYGEGISDMIYSPRLTRRYGTYDYDNYPYYPPVCTTPSCNGLPSKTVQADKDNQTIILPCAVNSPNTKVKLYKQIEKPENTTATTTTTTTSTNYTEIQLTGVNTTAGITFDPKVGFIINVTEQVTPPYGIYKCTPELTTTEVLIIKVTTGVESETKKESDNRSGNAKYSFDTSAHDTLGDRIKCCSSGAKPPMIYNTLCSTKYGCTTARQQLQEFKNPDRSDIRSGHCRSFTIGSTYRSPSVPAIGVFRCVGEGIDVTREFYIPATSYLDKSNPNKSAIYYDNEISGLNKSDLIKFSGGAGNGYGGYGSGAVIQNQLIAYANQSLSLACHPSNYFFALGVRWSIVWQNETTQLVPAKGAYVIGDTIETELSNELKIKASKDIHSVICHAPLYDSSEWVDQTLYFNITHTEAPKIVGPTHETITWRIGDTDKELNCEATGVPSPTFSWIEPVKYDEKYDILTGTYKTSPNWRAYTLNRATLWGVGNSTLKFKQVLSTMGGDYTCTAAGSYILGHTSAIKTFTVKVTDTLIESTTAGTTTTTTTPRPESSSISSIPTSGTSTVEPAVNNTTTERDPSSSPITGNPGPNDGGGIGAGMIIFICVMALAVVAAGTGFVWRRMKRARGGSSTGEEERLNRMSYQDLRM